MKKETNLEMVYDRETKVQYYRKRFKRNKRTFAKS